MDGLNIVFQDEYLMVVDKPAGLVVTPAESHKEKTLAEILKDEYSIDIERSGIVHRLDKDTSGLILVAKTPESFENLQNQFRDRTVKKEYLALVHGKLEKEVVVKGAIARNPQDRERFVVMEEGREAETIFKPISNIQYPISNFQSEFNKIQMRKLERSNYGQFTLVRCIPKTGRTHQIRVHLKHLGFPIVGDTRYGGRKTVRLDHRFCKRQFLHAERIEFDHPKTGERMSFVTPIPSDLKEVLDLLEKNG